MPARLRPGFPLLCLLVACGAPAEGTPGEETSPCNGGACLEGLQCRSDLCVDPDWQPTDGAETSPSGSGEETTGSPQPAQPSDQVDILFVVDNSGSMGDEQAKLSENIGGLITPLVDGGLDIRVAVTTTDDSNYWCRGAGVSNPESGQFVYSSCRSRLGDFYFSGDDTDAEAACTDFCDPDTGTNGANPWLDVSDGPSATQTLRCVLPQGVNGCGFESTLESGRKALALAGGDGQDESGFVRDGAHLAVVFVTDEADCSFNPSHQATVFGEEGVGNQEFWSLPDVQQSPTSAVCWNAGVDCDFSQASDQCVSADKDVDGNATASADQAVLHPVARFRGQLEALRQDKLSSGAEVFVFGLVGVPENYGGVMTYAEGPDGTSPDSFQAKFGIGQGCSSMVAEAVPPVRIRELAEGSAWGDNGKLYSVCAADYGPALGDMASTIIDYTP
ncbi:MAG: vWA domain-containing protein [Nannocystales bacterium]